MTSKQSISDELITLVRGSTRPLCTVIGLMSCVMLQVEFREVPTWLLIFTGGMLSFWFGEKFLRNLVVK